MDSRATVLLGASGTDVKRFDHSLGSRPISLEEEEAAGWYQQTLKLYDSHSAKLIQFLRHLGLNKYEVDDVVQESFLRLARHLKEGRNEVNLLSWLYRVARNLAMDVHRSNRREHKEYESEFEVQEEPVDPNANPEWAFLQKEQVRRLKGALSLLTSKQYKSIMLRAQGLHYREIGELLGVSEQRALHLVKRALKRMVGGL